jgi:hypothetical protein
MIIGFMKQIEKNTYKFSGVHLTKTLLLLLGPFLRVAKISDASNVIIFFEFMLKISLLFTSNVFTASLTPAITPASKKSKFLAENIDFLYFSRTPTRLRFFVEEENFIAAGLTTDFLARYTSPFCVSNKALTP